MELKQHPGFDVSEGLLEAIRTFPVRREVEHCETRIIVPPFDFYADCPRCGTRIKVRSFSGVGEIEDVFDAVFEWMNQPKAQEEALRRQLAFKEEMGPVADSQDHR
jgi:hypothetical protein